jgi:hypothetical protein
MQTSGTGETPVSQIVSKASRSAGQRLDQATRAFFEPRFGNDLGYVRIHTDAAGQAAARSLDALAFTAGQEIVFAGGQYAPETSAGRRLIAHELTHVIQQRRDGAIRIQRQQKVGAARAHQGMTMAEYKNWERAHPNSRFSYVGTFSAKSIYERHSQDRLRRRGYVQALTLPGGYRGARIEIWLSDVGPGHEIRVFRDPQTTNGTASPTEKPAPVSEESTVEVEGLPDNLNLTAAPEAQYGKEIASQANAVIMGLRGYAILYQDGTIELFVEGSAPYTLRPVPGGQGYLFYDEKGKSTGTIITVDRKGIFEQ